MRKFISMMVFVVAIFAMSGCNSTGNAIASELSGDDRESVSSVSLSDLSQGYAVTYTPLDGSESGEFTLAYCDGQVEMTHTIKSAPVVGKWGEFQVDDNFLHLDLYYQLPGNEEFIHDELSFMTTGGVFNVDEQAGSDIPYVVSSIKKNPCGDDDHDEDHEH